MILSKSFLFFSLLLIPSYIVFAQSSAYTQYSTSFPYVTTCSNDQYFDAALLKCSPCPANAQQKSGDPTKCDCISNNYYYGVNQGGGSLLCIPCDFNYTRSTDGFGCVTINSSCNSTELQVVAAESQLSGDLYSSASSSNSSSQPRVGPAFCVSCTNGTWPDPSGQRCTPCANVTPRIGGSSSIVNCCTASRTQDGMCLDYVSNSAIGNFSSLNTFSSPATSAFIAQRQVAAFSLCLMNLNSIIVQSSPRLLLSNATACQTLANIIAMQFYYNGTGYAYYFYDKYLWNPTPSPWTNNPPRIAIPFLAYPSTYYQDINSISYNWIPASYQQNDPLLIKLAKYSATGQFLGLFDAFDTHLQLCGGGYTDGKGAFTFGVEFSKSCTIRADALWNSTLYDTTFVDPYIVFTQSGSTYMIPCPVVIQNYRLSTGGTPNLNTDESGWIYHRRFFLIDRVSGITTNNGKNALTIMRYAATITVLITLTTGESYIQPPLFVVNYNELSLSDYGTGKLVQVSFRSTYRMDLYQQIINIWIATGVLSFVGALLAFLRTFIWYARTNSAPINLTTIGKLFVYIANILGTVFFIVMAGVSIWWLIFYKRQGTITVVMPTSSQLASFTALIAIAFSLKTIDILHLIFRQGRINIFFMDWEKPKGKDEYDVPIWRTYFVANEYQELQTFRRVNLTFQLFIVLLLLKVVNLENIAIMEPGTTLFPSDVQYQPGYSAILRVGIAFSVWLGTANISVFILVEDLYGFYVHGLSPHGQTEVNIKDMVRNLERESKQLSGTRGLLAKSHDQTFIVHINRAFLQLYSHALRAYRSELPTQKKTVADEASATELMNSYRNLNKLLCSFINRSLPEHAYTIRGRTLLEKIFNYEFVSAGPYETLDNEQNILYIDNDKNFINAIFAGHENSLFVWNTATFLFIDYFALNYVLAAIVTYILNLIAERLCMSLSRKNISAKTLIPKSFLI